MNIVCGAAIFLSAFLLFQVQPLIARLFLPWFGGVPSVWTTCMLFFESVLLLGYGYSHLMAKKVPSGRQMWVHGGVLAVVTAVLAIQTAAWGCPLLPGRDLAPADGSVPLLSLLGLLTVTAGVPYLVVSTTSPLLQSWFARVFPDRPVYRLYALSNAGSLLALLTYPVLVEPHFTLREQAMLWGGGFLVFAGLCCAFGVRASGCSSSRAVTEASRSGPEASSEKGIPIHPDKGDGEAELPKSSAILDWVRWIGLSAIPSAMLLAVTNHVTQEVSPIPMMWVVPMVIYLASFILTFDRDWFYRRPVWTWLLGASSLLCCVALYQGFLMPLGAQVFLFFTLLMAASMVCHGELARRRPSKERLTAFYLAMSIGGALGGIFVGGVAPLAFLGFWELNLSILAAWMAVMMTAEAPKGSLGKVRVWATVAMFAFLLLALSAEMFPKESERLRFRDFYGRYSVRSGLWKDRGRECAAMYSGKTAHGIQCESPDPKDPMSYYNRKSGIGVLLEGVRRENPEGGKVRMAVVGLGVGTLAAYGAKGDEIVFYELNPGVIDLAGGKGGFFSYVRDSQAKVRMVSGDARISMGRDHQERPGEKYDVIVLDAFSSDSVPAHLLTREAFSLYLEMLEPQGVIAAHISNRYVNMLPIFRAISMEMNLEAGISSDPFDWFEDAPWYSQSDWVALDRRGRWRRLENYVGLDGETHLKSELPPILWTDDYAPIYPLIHWR